MSYNIHLKALTRGTEHRSGYSEPEFLGGKNQFEKYSFYYINRPNDGFILQYL